MFVIIGAWAEFVHGERKLLMFVVAEEEGEEKRMNLEECHDEWAVIGRWEDYMAFPDDVNFGLLGKTPRSRPSQGRRKRFLGRGWSDVKFGIACLPGIANTGLTSCPIARWCGI